MLGDDDTDVAERPTTQATLPKPPPPILPASVRPARSRRRWLRPLLFLLLPIALIVAAYEYVTGGQLMSTDDSYIEADKVGVATDVAGIVTQIDVRENQQVSAGQELYKLDDLPFRLALNKADAQVGIVENTLKALQSNYREMQSEIKQAQNDVDYYATEYKRQDGLLASHVSSQSAVDLASRNLRNAQQKLVSLDQQLGGVAANLNEDPSGSVETNPRYLEAVAVRNEAARELAHTAVKAPFAGVVTNVSAIAVGKYLPAATPAFDLVATDHVWIVANPKETQLTYVKPGQTVGITVDTYPDAHWTGTVDSISPAASQEFSLLPAQNTSGNWVKVVQRIPMRVRVDISDKSLPDLRAGMSVEVDVDTGHTRGLPHFIAAWLEPSKP